ncbi:DNA topoisomerase IB [Roseiterribacter gracilis]|uniref:DNA topoisomerase n=1 Tax=Roseiterribacter gracilis TaxID=2812848 RepID=A0A8S8XBV0_9PROT|nr:DNA topoisomerase [Rhodospirillales bacterium TMPK1]
MTFASTDTIEPAPTMPSPPVAARQAGLRYVSDESPGITRRKARGGFTYLAADGTQIRDDKSLRRIRALAIPPAYTDVWICPLPNGHIQATGRDARGRKQYRYHAKWREVRDEAKYERTLAFAEALPAIRARVDADLRRTGLPREKLLATVVRLLESTLIRVGNEEYARDNGSYGLTTMRDKHVETEGAKIRFEFKGKSGKKHAVEIRDRRLAKIVAACQALPGQELFQYLDENDERRSISSDDVNAYLREITGQDFTAKDFRTWAGTVLAALALQAFESFDSQAAAKRQVTEAIEKVAARLGNTKAVCRKCYIHPEIFAAHLDGSLAERLKVETEIELVQGLTSMSSEETAVLAFLQQRLAKAVSKTKKKRAAKKTGAKRMRTH